MHTTKLSFKAFNWPQKNSGMGLRTTSAMHVWLRVCALDLPVKSPSMQIIEMGKEGHSFILVIASESGRSLAEGMESLMFGLVHVFYGT